MARPSSVAEVREAHVDRDKLVFAVGYDGSNGGQAAMHMVLKYFLCKRSMAKAHAIHVYDDKKDYLPPSQRKQAIEKYLEVYDISMGKRVTKHMLPRLEADDTPGRLICQFANDPGKEVDFCVCGFFGRKRTTFDHGEHLMASNVNYMMQYTRCSVVVVKEEFLPYSFIHWLVCVDHNKHSEKAVMDALCLSETDDRITVLHIAMRDEDADKVKEAYGHLIQRCTEKFARTRKVTLVVQAEGGSTTPADDILDYADANNANILCVGTDAARVRRGNSYLGSCAAKVLVG